MVLIGRIHDVPHRKKLDFYKYIYIYIYIKREREREVHVGCPCVVLGSPLSARLINTVSNIESAKSK